MKTLIALAATFFFSLPAFAQVKEPEVLEVLFERDFSVSIELKPEVFIPNIQGYACAWPAIDVPSRRLWDMKLFHEMGGGFGVKGTGLAIKNPDMQHCGWPSPEEVFGSAWVEGAMAQLPVKIKREIVLSEDWNGRKQKMLRETIEASLGKVEVFSEAFVSLEK